MGRPTTRKGARGRDVALMIEAVACVSKGWESAVRLRVAKRKLKKRRKCTKGNISARPAKF